MSTVLSKIAKKGFARFLVLYLCLGLAAPATPLMAAPGDITNNTGYIPFDQAFFAFEVEKTLDSLRGVATWDELEKMLDDPYAFQVLLAQPGYPCDFGTASDNITGRPLVDNTTGQMLCASMGNDQGWPAYQRTDGRRRGVQYRLAPDNVLPCQPGEANCNEVLRSFLYRIAGTDNVCAPGTPNCFEVPLPPHIVHPLNYNYQSGEELRILNIDYPGGNFSVPGNLCPAWADPPQFVNPGDPCPIPSGEVMYFNPNAVVPDPTTNFCSPVQTAIFTDPTPVYRYVPRPITVSPGIDRVEESELGINYNSPLQSDSVTFVGESCVKTLEFVYSPGPGPDGSLQVDEGICLCGGDPGDPNYVGFGSIDPDQYSTAAVEIAGVDRVTGPAYVLGPDPVAGTDLLYDPVRGTIWPRDPVTGYALVNGVADNTGTGQSLRKPSLRIPEFGGTPGAPNYLFNSRDNLFELARLDAIANGATDNQALAVAAEQWQAFLAPSNENDYYRNREAAAMLGKAIFWDQQLGSDSVQSCSSCHFHAGADNRTKNQLNPNHLSGDFTFQVKGPNQELEPADFPFHKLYDISIAGDPACMLPVVTPFGRVACDADNIKSDANDVASSMGVFFGNFGDIPPIGTFNPADNTGVRSVPPDIRTNTPLNFRVQLEAAVTLGRTDISALNTGNLDPIPGFQGVRRVEPRNTPTIFEPAMNFDNFWDGRARHDFNGGSVFGATDPQSHVWVFDNVSNTLVPTRQIIRFVSVASLFTGPGLSEFEMSQRGRNWAKVGKKLLQSGATPLANQLVDPTDSVLGPYSNQPGVNNACASLPVEDRSGDGSGTLAVGKPGLCISYPGLIKRAYYPALWQNNGAQRIVGTTSGCTKPMVNGKRDPSDPPNCDPFDGYVLSLDNNAVVPTATNQFTQMEANVSLFFGLGAQAWFALLIPDDTPLDRFFEANPDAFKSFGESGEAFLVLDIPNCSAVGNLQTCFTETGNFKRDSQAVNPDLHVRVNCSTEACDNFDANSIPTFGTRNMNDPDPLMGMDFFLGSNLSLKNPNFRSLRCGECHQGGPLTDHTFQVSHQMHFGDWIKEFVTPGLELFPEPLTRGRVPHPFALESELGRNAQDAVERNMADLELDEFGFPRGQALFDNGMYNIGVRPIHEDQGRGGNDPFGWPLSLAVLALKNVGGPDYHPGGDNAANGFALPQFPGIPLPNWEPDPTLINAETGLPGDPIGGGLYGPNQHDQQINPGFDEEPLNPKLPPYLAKWANNINVGDEVEQDELFTGLNTLLHEPILEGFIDAWGPFNPAATLSEAMNNSRQKAMATWPNVNRANVQGAFKAPTLRNAELTGPYFHTGSKLTLRQQLDFYARGGDFPISNSAHRDLLITKFDIEDEALGGFIDPATGLAVLPNTGGVPEFTEEQKEAIKIAVVDFLLELTDDRVAFERAPFDHPEVIIPLDGTAPENHGGRPAMFNDPRFRVVPAVGEAGRETLGLGRLPNFLNITSGPRCTPTPGGIQAAPVSPFSRIYADIPECTGALSHYDSDTTRAVAAAGAVGSTNTGATAASTGVAAGGTGSTVLARNTGIAFTAPTVSPVNAVTLDIAPSGLQAAGTTVTFSAAASGGSGTYQYRFWLHNGTSWTILQDFGPAATYQWTPPSAGTYIVQVHARSAGSTAEFEAWTGIEYTVR